MRTVGTRRTIIRTNIINNNALCPVLIGESEGWVF
jgi:hypothetical protein